MHQDFAELLGDSPADRYELRSDPLSGQWVAYTPSHVDKPNGFTSQSCPFCPPNIDSAGVPTGRRLLDGSWTAHSIENRWPVLHNGPAPGPAAGPALGPGTLPGRGAHEVIVCTARHLRSWHELTDAEATAAAGLWCERAAALAVRQPHVVGWCNVGSEANASQPHLHTQLLASPVRFEVPSAEEAALQPGSCVLCRPDPTRVLLCDGALVATAPVAPTAPYETVLASRSHDRFPPEPERVGPLLVELCRRVAVLAAAHDLPLTYNLALHVDHHWHLHVQPRLRRLGGREHGTGLWAVRLDPETALERLRRAADVDLTDGTVLL